MLPTAGPICTTCSSREVMLMKVIAHPNPALKQRACAVDPASDPDLRSLVARMLETMYEAHGIGLAATQVGVLKRVVVYDLGEERPEPVALCNPEIVSMSEETVTDDEGCLSVPGIAVPVERAARVRCRALTLEGDPVEMEADGLLARLLQHEIDHLDGVLILDRASSEARKEALRAYREALTSSIGASPTQ